MLHNVAVWIILTNLSRWRNAIQPIWPRLQFGTSYSSLREALKNTYAWATFKPISFLHYTHESSVCFYIPKPYKILPCVAFQNHYFYQEYISIFKIENIGAIWTWKAGILKQLTNCRPHRASYLFILSLIGELSRNYQDQFKDAWILSSVSEHCMRPVIPSTRRRC